MNKKLLESVSNGAKTRFQLVTEREPSTVYDYYLELLMEPKISIKEFPKPATCKDSCGDCAAATKAACFVTHTSVDDCKDVNKKEVHELCDKLGVPKKLLKESTRLALYASHPNIASERNEVYECPNKCEECADAVNYFCDVFLQKNGVDISGEAFGDELSAYKRLELAVYNKLFPTK